MSSYGSDAGNTPPQQPEQPPQGYQPPPQQPQGYEPPPQAYQPPAQGYQPPPPGYQPPQMGMGAPVVAPPRRRSPLLIIGIIVVALLLVCGIGFFAIFGLALNATQPVADAGQTYMTALSNGDYSKAFDLSAPSLQQEAGNAQGLQTALSSKQPVSWNFTSRNVNNDQGELQGTDTYKDGTTGTVDLVLSKIGNDWKVAGVHFQ